MTVDVFIGVRISCRLLACEFCSSPEMLCCPHSTKPGRSFLPVIPQSSQTRSCCIRSFHAEAATCCSRRLPSCVLHKVHFARPTIVHKTMDPARSLLPIVRARFACLRRLTATDQWAHISRNPRFLRTWFSSSLLFEAILTAVVYIWGWAAAGQPFLVAAPAVAHVAVVTGALVAVHFHGPIPHSKILFPAYNLLKIYIVFYPFIQQVQNLCPPLSARQWLPLFARWPSVSRNFHACTDTCFYCKMIHLCCRNHGEVGGDTLQLGSSALSRCNLHVWFQPSHGR